MGYCKSEQTVILLLKAQPYALNKCVIISSIAFSKLLYFALLSQDTTPLLREVPLLMRLLSQKCRQRERTSLRDGLRLPSNSTLKIIRRQLLYAMKPEGSFYMCIKFQSKVPTQ